MRIKSWMLGIIVIVLIFGGIGVTSVTGYWQTTSNKKPATYTSGEFAGQYNPADIRGSYTFGEISKLFKVPLADLEKAFALESTRDVSDFQVKELESLYAGTGIGTGSIRLFVALYKGLPYTLSAKEYLLESAVSLLKEKAVLTPEQVTFLNTQSVNMTQGVPTPTVSSTAAPSATASETHTPTAGSITGKTTFQELLDWGASEKDISAVIKESLPAKSLAIKDYATQKGIEFSTIRAELQALLGALK